MCSGLFFLLEKLVMIQTIQFTSENLHLLYKVFDGNLFQQHYRYFRRGNLKRKMVAVIPCDQQLFRSKMALRSWPYVEKCLEGLEVFWVAYTCFDLNLEIFVESR
jgi:hypothetical protein